MSSQASVVPSSPIDSLTFVNDSQDKWYSIRQSDLFFQPPNRWFKDVDKKHLIFFGTWFILAWISYFWLQCIWLSFTSVDRLLCQSQENYAAAFMLLISDF